MSIIIIVINIFLYAKRLRQVENGWLMLEREIDSNENNLDSLFSKHLIYHRDPEPEIALYPNDISSRSLSSLEFIILFLSPSLSLSLMWVILIRPRKIVLDGN